MKVKRLILGAAPKSGLKDTSLTEAGDKFATMPRPSQYTHPKNGNNHASYNPIPVEPA